VVHLFTPDVRAYYDLERLWRDAPRIAVDDSVARTG
jgi:ribosomal silencing factor RsfS